VILAVADKLLNAWIDGGIAQASDAPQAGENRQQATGDRR
jgi:hypothetical protein